MKYKKQIYIIALTIVAVALAVFFGIKLFKKHLIQSGYGNTPNSANQYAKDVTMVQLIANPEKYDGELVRVIGVGHLEFEGDCIVLSKEDLQYSVGNSIWIEFGEKAISYEEAKQYNGEYVIVEGIFDKDFCGHMDMFLGSIRDISRYEPWNAPYNPLDMYSITKTGNFTYAYKVVDKNGKELFSGESNTKVPEVTQVNTHILEVTMQTGTGRATNWAVYCDVENSKLSETFQYVLMAQGDYVIYADYNDGNPRVVVQNIFDKSTYYETYDLVNCSPVADVIVDVVRWAEPDGEGKAVITYYTGEDYEETEFTISFP